MTSSGSIGSSSQLNTSQVTFYSITGQRLNTFTLTSTAGYQLCPGATSYTIFCLTAPTGGYLYFGKKLLFEPNGAAAVSDRLGSVRNAGSAISYYPWGEEMTSTANGQFKFGTYFRDMVGQDYAQNRYYSSNLGRFYTPDPSGRKAVNPKNPTSWNMYLYANDDPVNGNDPTGMDVVATDPYTAYVQSLCSSVNINTSDPYNSFCGGGNGAGWGSESAIGAAVEDTVEQYDSTVYNLGPNTPTFSVTTTTSSDDDPVSSSLGTTFGDASTSLFNDTSNSGGQSYQGANPPQPPSPSSPIPPWTTCLFAPHSFVQTMYGPPQGPSDPLVGNSNEIPWQPTNRGWQQVTDPAGLALGGAAAAGLNIILNTIADCSLRWQ